MSRTFYCPICREPLRIADKRLKPYPEDVVTSGEVTTVYNLECMTCPDLIELTLEVGRRD